MTSTFRASTLRALALLLPLTLIGCGGGDAPVPAAPADAPPPTAPAKGANVAVPRGPAAVKAIQQTKGQN